MKTAIYCRLSEEDKNKRAKTDESESIQNQKMLLTQYAAERGWDIYHIYCDEDYTGADRNRPAFQKLLNDAETRKFDMILCKSQSRFTREMEIVEKYIHGLFPLWGVRFVSVVDQADTEVKGNKKARQINGLMNEWYLEDMSESIKSVLTNKRRNGMHIGSFALYGYQKDPEKKGGLIIDEEAAVIVREVFTLFAQGYGKTAIARMLNDRGVPNPTEYKRRKGLRYRQPQTPNSTLWKYSAISHMLANESYIGNMIQGRYGSVSYKTKTNKPKPRREWIRAEGTHTPIIDRELWDRVQSLLRQKAKPFTTGAVGLFAQKTRCQYCGYTMRSSKNRGKYYLKCSTKHMAKEACQGAFISVKLLEDTVLAELNRLSRLLLDKDVPYAGAVIRENTARLLQKLKGEIAVYTQKVNDYDNGLKAAYMDKVRGVISEADYLTFSQAFAQDRERAKQTIADLRHRMDDAMQREKDTGKDQAENQAENQAKNQAEDFARYLTLTRLTRDMVDTLIDYISIGRRDSAENRLPVEIHWKF